MVEACGTESFQAVHRIWSPSHLLPIYLSRRRVPREGLRLRRKQTPLRRLFAAHLFACLFMELRKEPPISIPVFYNHSACR